MIPKFRAWNIESQCMLNHDFIVNTVIQNGEIVRDFSDILEHDDMFILMQSTGLKDKNGKEIFGGDIVRIINNLQENEVDYNAQIVFKDGGFCAVDGTEDNYSIRRYNLHAFGMELKIIGNVHEHPGLLKEDGEDE